MAVDMNMSMDNIAFELTYIKKSFENDEYRLSSLDCDIEQIRSFLSSFNLHATRLDSLPIPESTRVFIKTKVELINSELKKYDDINTTIPFMVRWNVCRINILVIISCLAADIACFDSGIDIRDK